MPNIKPILFNTDMVRALLDNRKTVTRRVVKPQPPATTHVAKVRYSWCWSWWEDSDSHQMKPPYCPGDILYVRESFAKISDWTTVDPDVGMFDGYIYKADWMDGAEHPKWHPSIHMPREAARLFLRVTDVRVERLQDITDDEILAEGIVSKRPDWLRIDFVDEWNATIKVANLALYGWNANPWVFVISFERISKEEASQI